MFWLDSAVRHTETNVSFGLFAGNGGPHAYVGFGSQAAAQSPSACVRCTLRSGNSSSECPELAVKQTEFAMRRPTGYSQEQKVRPEGADHQWRKIPPRKLSVDLVADGRGGRVQRPEMTGLVALSAAGAR